MKRLHIPSVATVSVLALSIASRNARATALPNGLYDPKACGGVPCFKVTNSSSIGSAIQGNAANSGASTGIGVWGFSDLGWGVYGISNGTGSAGVGVVGTSGAGYGVLGSSNTGIGVQAKTSGNSANAAVDATSTTGTGTAVRATVQGTGNGSAVWATGPTNGYGVFGGTAGTGYGVYGFNSSTGYGVYGYNHAGGYAGYFDGPAFTTSGMWSGSDVRLKKDIKDAPYGLGHLLKLRPVTYRWKEGSNGGTQLGLIAQEVQKIIPEVVHSDGASQMLSINYPALVPVVIKAIQEQQRVVDAQRETIERQEVRIASLERGRGPVASVVSSGVAGGVALGLLPFGLVAVLLRRRQRKQI